MNKMKNKEKLFDIIQSARNLPALPQVLIKLLEACDNENTPPGKLTQIISTDPSISTKVLRLANSSYTGLAKKFNSLNQAVVYLGSDTIRNIAITASVQQVFCKTKTNQMFNLKHFWWHSIMCAALAKKIAKKISYKFEEEAFLSGLMHDIGQLLLLTNKTDLYVSILENSNNNVNTTILEKETIGMSHCEAGAWLIRQWKLKSFMADAVLYHHEKPERIKDAFPLVKIIYVANALCHGYCEDKNPGNEVAKILLGISEKDVADITYGAHGEVENIAESLEIQLEPPDITKTTGTEKYSREHNELLNNVKDITMLYGTLHSLTKTTDKDSIIKSIDKGLKIALNVNKVLCFLYDFEKNILAGYSPKKEDQDDLINHMEIPFKSDRGMLVISLAKKITVDSFGILTGINKTIVDEQIISLLGTEGMLVIPMVTQEKHIGVIVIGLSKTCFMSISKQLYFLNMFAGQAAMCIHAYDLKQNQIRVVLAERMKSASTIARKLAHEINNPLAIIKNYLKILELKIPEKRLAANEIHIIKEEIDRIADLILQLSDFSKTAFNPEPVDINTLFWNLLKILKKSILLPSMIDVHFTPETSIHTVVTDKNSVKQVFINLIKNAAEAMPDGGNIFIETKQIFKTNQSLPEKKEGKKYFEITIKDDGPGIPENILPHLFEPFKSSKGKGHSGLGLSIVHGIIANLGGDITCTSIINQGTAFKITLPTNCGQR